MGLMTSPWTTALAGAAGFMAALAIVRARAAASPRSRQCVKDPLKIAFEGVSLSGLSIAEFWARFIKVGALAETRVPPSFVPRAGDVLTVTTPKTGQTLLIAMLRRISLGSDSSVSDASLAVSVKGEAGSVPWLEHPNSRGIVHLDQPGRFRVFKSHLKHSSVAAFIAANPGTKFITTLRQPHDVARSLYRHARGVYVARIAKGDATEFDNVFTVDDFALIDLGYENNLVDWVRAADCPNVLVLFFEETLADPERAIRRIATFVGVDANQDLVDSVLSSTSYANMAKSSAFTNVFAGGGKYGLGRKCLSAEACEAIDRRWKEIVEPALRVASYEDLYRRSTGLEL